VAASQVADILVGTAVVPIQGRHPIPLAQQALTLADAAGPGRVTLGIGVQAFAAAQLGLHLGARIAERYREAAERLAGIVLIALGLFLAAEHLLTWP